MESTPSSDSRAEIEERFQAAVSFIKSLPSADSAPSPVTLSNEDKLQFYGLYKQATEGACSTPQPGFFDMVGRYKWEAWRKLGDLDKTAAMQQYVESLLRKAAAMPPSADLTRFVEAVTPVRRKTQQSQQSQLQQNQESQEKQPHAGSAQNSTPSLPANYLNQSVSSNVVDKAEMIANQVDQLRQVVLQDSLKVARLQQTLEGGASNESEHSELFDVLERRLKAAHKEREELFARVEQVERLGAQVLAELKNTQDAIVSSAWLFSGLAVATVVVTALLTRRWPKK